MKRITLLCLLSLLPARAFALFGVGDIVFDPAAFAQMIQAYTQGQSQLSALGNIVGLNTQQLDTLRTIDTAIGVAKGSIDPKQLTMGQLALLSQGLGVDARGAVSKIYQAAGPFAGALDIFMGSTIESFRSEQGPWYAYQDWATNTSMNAIGSAVGMESNEIQFAKAVAMMPPGLRQENNAKIAAGVAVLSAERYSKAAEQRRLALQAEANLSKEAAQRGAEAKTLNDSVAAANEQAASNSRMQAISAQQQNAANETIIIQGDSTRAVLTDMDARRARDDAERRLQLRLSGNGL